MTPNMPLDKAVADVRRRLIGHAPELKARGFPSACAAMSEAAALLAQMLELHTALVEREEKLTAEVVRLRP